jgi:4-amino-4-deoxy-L-arabinose transferase-like glycosyltransferase
MYRRHNAIIEAMSVAVEDAQIRAPAEDNPLLRGLARYRVAIFIFVGLFYILAFNGQWRVGRDSALYRGVGHSLATGQGYTFRGERQTHVYPGLPYVLAGFERVFGEKIHDPVPELLLMVSLAVLTLVVVYKLIAMHFSTWVAVHVTFVLGLHWRFLQQANELMTDTPFVLGVCLALLGYERLRIALTTRQRLRATLITLAGLVLAAVMRPTFWALAAAWIPACIWGLSRGPNRKSYAIALGACAAVILLWLAIDPRTTAFHPFQGVYEKDAIEKVENLSDHTAFPKMIQALAKVA